MSNKSDEVIDINVLSRLDNALDGMRKAKPEERSELARRYAVSITELEKVIAYFKVFVVEYKQ